MYRLKTFIGLFVFSFLLVGCANYVLPNNSYITTDDKYCVTSDDCACGTNINTGACFYGNKDYVNTLKQCPDFCTGIAGNFLIKCVNNKCQQVNVGNVDESYCDVDSDCVRQGSCCDCGLGKYVNKKYKVEPVCHVVCKCATEASMGKCIGNKCTAVPMTNPFKGFCGTSTLGSCQIDSDCVNGGCSGQVCQSKNEEPVITTCEYLDCYNADPYGVGCKCKNNKCQWIQTLFVD